MIFFFTVITMWVAVREIPENMINTRLNMSFRLSENSCPSKVFKNIFHYNYGLNLLKNFGTNFMCPVETGRKLNVHKTFRRRAGHFLNVLRIHRRLSMILKTSNKSIWRNVFWYVKVCIFGNCIQYTLHWDQTK